MVNVNKENSSNTSTVYIGGKHHCALVGRANTGLEFAGVMGWMTQSSNSFILT